MSGDLEPCPFCGGDDVKTHGPYGWYRYWCISHNCKSFYCGAAAAFKGFHSEEAAITAWNTRATPEADVIAGLVEVLEIAIEEHDFSVGRSNFDGHWTNEARAALSRVEKGGV